MCMRSSHGGVQAAYTAMRGSTSPMFWPFVDLATLGLQTIPKKQRNKVISEIPKFDKKKISVIGLDL